MNTRLTKNLKAIQEQLMEAQAIALEYEELLKKQWRAMARAQKLLRGDRETEQLVLFK